MGTTHPTPAPSGVVESVAPLTVNIDGTTYNREELDFEVRVLPDVQVTASEGLVMPALAQYPRSGMH